MSISLSKRAQPLLVAVALWAPLTGHSFVEFAIPTGGSGPEGLELGLDGNVWFTEFAGNKIGRITPAGLVTEFQLPVNNQGQSSGPVAILRAPDGALWFTMSNASQIGRITTTGNLHFFPTPTANSGPEGIAVGSDGNIWFTEAAANQIGRLAPSNGSITEFPVPTTNSQLSRIALARDGNLWFTESNANKIARITTGGLITEFTVPTANSEPFGIRGIGGSVFFTERNASKIGQFKLSNNTFTEILTPTSNSQPVSLLAGPDGNIYFTEFTGGKIGQITNTMTLTEFTPPTANSGLSGLTVGSDGAIWFGEANPNQIGRLVPLSSSIQLFAAVLPSSRSIVVGGTPATVFATIVNAGSTTATACAINDVTFVPATIDFQTTDPATNVLTGALDTPVDIPAGANQTFVLTVTPTAPFPPTATELGFACSNAGAAPIDFGLNTILASASTTPVPDVVALAATATNNGIFHIAGASGSNAFAVATVNVGTAGTITATANTGGVTLPLTIDICQTDPTTGQCISAIGPSVTATINANATPTFAIFGNTSGAISFLPATNRIFVEFSDTNGIVRGSTSTAVTAQ